MKKRRITIKQYFKYNSEIKSLHILNYSFDFGLYDIFINLYCGGCLCSIDKNKMKNFTEYVNFILKHKINNINTTPSFFNILASFNTKLKDIKYVHLGGEKVTYPMISRYNRILSTNCNIYNGYGPCECTVGCLIYKLSKKEREGVYRSLNSVPIGKPTDDSHILILDEENNQVPIGSIGEIYVSGNSLGIGYVKNEDNIGRFIELDTYENKRFYKTGDLARWLEDGNIEFIGRKDSQIKVNGFRIELSEIDTILLKFDEIIDAKTISIQLNQQNSIISIIYTSDNISVQEIKRRLADYLPYYMIPSRIIVGEIPYLSSGKVDIVKIKEKYIMGEL